MSGRRAGSNESGLKRKQKKGKSILTRQLLRWAYPRVLDTLWTAERREPS